jgi:omega-amidase
MKITLLQRNITWADTQANIDGTQAMVDECPDTDVIVLPEMWSTGFIDKPQGIVGGTTMDDNAALKSMGDIARGRDCAVAGSLAVEDGGKFYNRFFFVKPDGTFDRYDKHHLFGYGGESESFTPGNKRVVSEFRGIRFMLNVCYDMRFPIWQRNFNEYDVLIVVANWPESRAAAWDTLLRARAIENQCFAVGVNRTGNDPLCKYAGGSAIINAYGQPVVVCGKQQQTITAKIDMKELSHFRKKFPVLNDADRIK